MSFLYSAVVVAPELAKTAMIRCLSPRPPSQPWLQFVSLHETSSKLQCVYTWMRDDSKAFSLCKRSLAHEHSSLGCLFILRRNTAIQCHAAYTSQLTPGQRWLQQVGLKVSAKCWRDQPHWRLFQDISSSRLKRSWCFCLNRN